jgi:hypothetical protein
LTGPAGLLPAARSPWPERVRLTALGVLCTAGWLASVLVGQNLKIGLVLHEIALAVHIMAMVVSLGAILLIDWVGLLWLLGRREIHEPGRVESAAKPLIWGGLAMLLISGAFIGPDLGDTPTVVKLVCVLVLMLNGLAIAPVMHRLLAMPESTAFTQLCRGVRARMLIALTVSQTCWWTAVIVGLLNSTLRRWPES